MAEFKYEITERIAVLSTNASGWERQLNMVSWNGKDPKYDIRDWSPDGSMFAGLLDYADEAFYRQNPTFAFDTLYEQMEWQVVLVLQTELGADELPYYTFFDADGRADWQQRVDAMLELALYDTGVVPEYGQQLLTLSTCGTSSIYTDERLAVLAVRVEE